MDSQVSLSCNSGLRLVELIPMSEGLLAIDLAISLREVIIEDLQLREVEILMTQYRRLLAHCSEWSARLGGCKLNHFCVGESIGYSINIVRNGTATTVSQ